MNASMDTFNSRGFLSGVIEGFYGAPWTRAERMQLLGWMRSGGLNSYVYGPKDDLHHRALWREPYGDEAAAGIRSLVEACRSHGIQFWYALGPGLDLRYSSTSDREALQNRIGQLLSLGCRNFCLLFDDIPDVMDEADRIEWGSFAAAQCGVTNALFHWTHRQAPEVRFLFCPTPYCGRMASRRLGGEDYLRIVGRELAPEIGVFWTGPEIVSREITVAHIRELQEQLKRPPIIWDNLQANDYDGHRFFCGPFSGRPPELRQAVGGILLNPNTEFPLNFVPIHTLAAYLRAGDSWDPRAAFLAALQEWLPAFSSVGRSLSLEELTLLADGYYLPYEVGPEAQALGDLTRRLMATPPADWGAQASEFLRRAEALRDSCVRMTELRDRSLFHALNRRVWELREELDLLCRFVRHRSIRANDAVPFESDFHRPLTYRGGMVAELQRLLVAHSDGTFSSALRPPDAGS